MNSIKRKTTMIATLAAILSLTMGFMPQSEAGSIPMTLDFGLICGVIVPTSALALTGGPTYASSFILANTGNGVQDVFGNIGLGWFGSEQTPVLHLPSGTTTLSSTDTGVGALGPVTMTDDGTNGTDEMFAQLVGAGGSSTIDISVDASAPINPPYSGVQSTTLVVTADSGDCHA